jgi:hypothetical protein
MKQKIDKVLDRVIEACGAVSDAAYRARSVHVWHSADGRVTPITEMDDRWLANAIGCVERGKANKTTHTRVLPFMRAELARRHPMRVVASNPHPIDGSDTSSIVPSPYMPGLASVERRVTQLEVNQRNQLAPADAALGQRIDVLAGRVEEWQRGARARRAAREAIEARVYSVEVSLARVVSAFEHMRDEVSSSKWRNTMREIVSYMRTGHWS